MSAATPILLGTAVWGDTFRTLFAGACLPSLLADGNIPALAAEHPLHFLILTARADAPALDADPAIRRLRRFATVDIALLPDAAIAAACGHYPDQMRLMCEAHRAIISRAAAMNAAIMMIYPDQIFADGSYRFVAHCIRSGARAVASQGLAADAGGMLPALAPLRRDDASLGVTAAELVALALAHPHPLMAQHFVDSPEFAPHPSFICWRLGERGLLVRSWHPAVAYIRPRRYDGFAASFDNDFIDCAIDHPGECFIVTSSADYLTVEACHRGKRRWPAGERHPDAALIGRWAAHPLNTNAFARNSFRQSCLFFAATPELDAVRAAGLAAATLEAQVFAALAASEAGAPGMAPIAPGVPVARED